MQAVWKGMTGWIFLVVLGGGGAAWAAFEDGMAAYKAGNYTVALKEWRPLAERGEAKAQHNLAVMYEHGRGVRQDWKEAFRWYSQAAAQGWASAQNNLGAMYELGRQVKRDFVVADMWYLLAKAQGNPSAAKNHETLVGRMTPDEIAKASALAAKWKPKSPRRAKTKIPETEPTPRPGAQAEQTE